MQTGQRRQETKGSLASIYIKFINFCILQLYPVHSLSWDPLQNFNHVRKSNAPPIQGLLKLGSLPSSLATSSYRVFTLNIPCIIAVAFSTSRLPLAWCAIHSFGWDTYLFADFSLFSLCNFGSCWDSSCLFQSLMLSYLQYPRDLPSKKCPETIWQRLL